MAVMIFQWLCSSFARVKELFRWLWFFKNVLTLITSPIRESWQMFNLFTKRITGKLSRTTGQSTYHLFAVKSSKRLFLTKYMPFWTKINSTMQSGFRLGDSCLYQLISIASVIYRNFAKHDEMQTRQWKMVFNPDITKQAVEGIFSVKKKKPFHPDLNFNGIPVAHDGDTAVFFP